MRLSRACRMTSDASNMEHMKHQQCLPWHEVSVRAAGGAIGCLVDGMSVAEVSIV